MIAWSERLWRRTATGATFRNRLAGRAWRISATHRTRRHLLVASDHPGRRPFTPRSNRLVHWVILINTVMSTSASWPINRYGTSWRTMTMWFDWSDRETIWEAIES